MPPNGPDRTSRTPAGSPLDHTAESSPEPARRDELVNEVIDAELRLRRRLVSTRMSPLLDLNLTMQQTKVLLALTFQDCAAGTDCGLSGQDLARHLGVGLATVTGIVDRLVGHGLVARAEDPDDRRIRRVELTAEGGALVARLRDAGVEHMRRILARLDDETLGNLAQVLDKLGTAAAEEAAATTAAGDPVDLDS